MAEHPYNCSTRLGAIETPVLGDRIPVAGYTILWELSSPLIWLRVSRAPEMCASTGSTLYLKTSPFATKFHPNTDAPWHHNGAHREGLQMKIGEVLRDLGSKVRKFVTYYPSSLLASLRAAATVVLATEHPLWLLLATILHHLPLRPSFNSFGASSRSPRAVTWQSSPVTLVHAAKPPSNGCTRRNKLNHRAVLSSHDKLFLRTSQPASAPPVHAGRGAFNQQLRSPHHRLVLPSSAAARESVSAFYGCFWSSRAASSSCPALAYTPRTTRGRAMHWGARFYLPTLGLRNAGTTTTCLPWGALDTNLSPLLFLHIQQARRGPRDLRLALQERRNGSSNYGCTLPVQKRC
ncbi:hypothetical protein B0H15DRAFT_955126 [Mycena belliarum]|uniref:Uncharacterized protein n=1 Tax=Mycena belliarum TaxID=1033014 RepID=A0AAD6TU61_9AGAR|nr:hypothetical protein B0H15DRAFT_955126 [Mycena belliae]